MLPIEILTIFPEIFSGFVSSSLIQKAQEKNLLAVSLTNIRDYSDAPHYKVDDSPYGGGAGMVMKPEPLAKAIEAAKEKLPEAKVILLSPSGKTFDQPTAHRLSKEKALILVCGRYEGVDERVVELLVDEEISIGDYILMGGEIPAMVIVEAAARLVQNVVGNDQSILHESFSESKEGALLEAPHYTRPAEFRGLKVPDVLLNGNHAHVEEWRHKEALRKTAARRPDLLKKAPTNAH